jgi:predicted small secreted protein
MMLKSCAMIIIAGMLAACNAESGQGSDARYTKGVKHASVDYKERSYGVVKAGPDTPLPLMQLDEPDEPVMIAIEE